MISMGYLGYALDPLPEQLPASTCLLRLDVNPDSSGREWIVPMEDTAEMSTLP